MGAISVIIAAGIVLALTIVVVKGFLFRFTKGKIFTSTNNLVVSASFYILFILQTCLFITDYVDWAPKYPILLRYLVIPDEMLSTMIYSVFIFWFCCSAICRVITGALTIRLRYFIIFSAASVLFGLMPTVPSAMAEQINTLTAASFYFWCISTIAVRAEHQFRKSKKEKEKQLAAAKSAKEKESEASAETEAVAS